MEKIIFATGNPGKLREIREILQNYEIVSMKEAGVEGPIEEGGSTFRENAYCKAKAIWDITGGLVMADDSGLEVDFLEGRPGVYSSRFMGEDTSYVVKNQEILRLLEGAKGKERRARFRACICAITAEGDVLYTEGTMEGEIAQAPAGEGGFGYDPILFLPEYDKTSAQLKEEEKNAISHRGQALRRIKEMLEKKNENTNYK